MLLPSQLSYQADVGSAALRSVVPIRASKMPFALRFPMRAGYRNAQCSEMYGCSQRLPRQFATELFSGKKRFWEL
jgi:hypothetical protein